LRVIIAAKARKTKASGEAKLVAELVFGVVLVLVLELEDEVLVADGPVLALDVNVELPVDVVDADLVTVLPEVLDPEVLDADVVETPVVEPLVVDEGLADPPVTANWML
jgi:hypothetical protein